MYLRLDLVHGRNYCRRRVDLVFLFCTFSFSVCGKNRTRKIESSKKLSNNLFFMADQICFLLVVKTNQYLTFKLTTLHNQNSFFFHVITLHINGTLIFAAVHDRLIIGEKSTESKFVKPMK